MTTTTDSTNSSTTNTATTTNATLTAGTTPTATSSSNATTTTIINNTTEQTTTPDGQELVYIGAGAGCAGLVVIVVIVVIVIFCLKKRRRREKHAPPTLPLVDGMGREVITPRQALQPRSPVIGDGPSVQEDENSGLSYTYVDPGNPTHVAVVTDSLGGRGDVYENIGGESTGTYIVPIGQLPHNVHSEPRLEDDTYMPMGPPVCRPNGTGYVNLPQFPPPALQTQVSGGHYQNSPCDGPEYGNVPTHSPALTHTGPSKTSPTATSHPHTGPSKTPMTALSHPHPSPKPHPSKGGHVPKTALKPKVTSSHGKPRVSAKPKERSNTAPITYQPSPVSLTPISPSQDDSDSESNPGEDYINVERGEGEGHNYVNAPEKKPKPRTAKRVPNGSSAPS